VNGVVPDYMSALVGYRAWQLSHEAYLLSLNHDTIDPWPAKMKRLATCSVVCEPTWSAGSIYLTSSAYVPVGSARLAASFEAVWERRKRKRNIANHHPPNAACSCGIYAAKSDQSSHFHDYAAGAPVWGEVYLWGKVQDYTEGYRAEFAYPKALSTNRGAKVAATIAERYGVPCLAVEQATWETDEDESSSVLACGSTGWVSTLSSSVFSTNYFGASEPAASHAPHIVLSKRWLKKLCGNGA